jgi:hypothetical protein
MTTNYLSLKLDFISNMLKVHQSIDQQSKRDKYQALAHLSINQISPGILTIIQ